MNDTLYRQGVRYTKHIHEVLRYRFTTNALSPVRFLIFGRGRSGSSALVSLLNSVSNICCDGEILNKRVLFPYSHVLAKCGNSRSTVYGCKILSYQIKHVQPIANREDFIRRLYKKNFRIIYLKRENLVYHALSNIRARAFSFSLKITEKQIYGKLKVDLNDLLRWIRGSEFLYKYEKLLLKGIPHLPLTYEKHIANDETHQSTAELVCSFLDVECGEAETEYRKVSPRTLRDSVANYDELANFLKDTPYARYID